MSAKKDKTIELGKTIYNAEFLRSVSEEKALKVYTNQKRDQVRNAWKQANGKTVRNHRKKKDDDKKTDDK